jgi:hypothetical protein
LLALESLKPFHCHTSHIENHPSHKILALKMCLSQYSVNYLPSWALKEVLFSYIYFLNCSTAHRVAEPHMQDFRLLQWCIWGLHSARMLLGASQPVSPKTILNYHPILHNVSEEQRLEPNISVLRSVLKTESIDISSTNKM